MGIVDRWFQAARLGIDHADLEMLINDTNQLDEKLKSSSEQISDLSQDILQDLKSHKEETKDLLNFFHVNEKNHTEACKSFCQLYRTIKAITHAAVFDAPFESEININEYLINNSIFHLKDINEAIVSNLDDISKKALKSTESHHKKSDLVKKLNQGKIIQALEIFSIKELFDYFKKEYCSLIERLDLNDCIINEKTKIFHLSDEDIDCLAENFPNLTHLSLVNCIISNETAQKLAQLTNLKSLNLKGCKLITEFDFLKSLINLKELSVESCDGFKPELVNVCLPPSLKHLNLSHTRIQTLEIEENCLENLEDINANNCLALTCIDLNNSSSLKILNASSCTNLTNEVNWSECTSIEDLNMSYCKKLSKLPSLTHFKNLKNLNLRKCENLEDIEGLRNSSIEKIDIALCKFSNEALEVLLTCNNLKTVILTSKGQISKTLLIKLEEKGVEFKRESF